MKTCARCKKENLKSEFLTDLRTKDKLGSWCRSCRNEYKRSERQLGLARIAKTEHRNKNHTHYRKVERRRSYLQKYGISLEQFENMLQQQNGCCGICGVHESNTPKKILCVDHDHKTLKVRKLLCDDCNRGLGCFKDAEHLIKLAHEYLISHRSRG